MHVRQAFDASAPVFATLDYTRVLRSVFKQAVGYALASSLAAAGCATAIDSDPATTRAVNPPAQTQTNASNAPSPKAATLEAMLADASAVAAADDAGAIPSAGSSGQAGTGDMAGQIAAGAAAPTNTTSRAVPVTVDCSMGPAQLFAGLSAQPFDAADFLIQAESTMGPQHLFAQGVLCANARNVLGCNAAVEDAMDQTKLTYADYVAMYGACSRYIVTSHGDEVKRYQSRDELLQFLGPIDSPQDALLLLYYDHRTIACGDAANAVDPASIREVDDGYEVVFIGPSLGCGAVPQRWNLHVARDGTVTEAAHDLNPVIPPCSGRRPAGLRSQHRGACDSGIGDHFAQMAHFEHASVAAFEMLATELEQLGAPSELIEAARSAAADEERHTTLTSELARAFGATPTTSDVAPREPRSLEAIAIENATEGCVRECFGAAFGWYQAEQATDRVVAAAMAEIAEDETRHAGLSFAIDAWLCSRLDESGRARVAAAREIAVSTLRSELARDVACAAASAELGLPDAATALRLYSVMERTLWTGPSPSVAGG